VARKTQIESKIELRSCLTQIFCESVPRGGAICVPLFALEAAVGASGQDEGQPVGDDHQRCLEGWSGHHFSHNLGRNSANKTKLLSINW
jgi:hypothetical protein